MSIARSLVAARRAPGRHGRRTDLPHPSGDPHRGLCTGGGHRHRGRIIAQKLGENIGQSVVVENKAGAGGNIAAQHIATAPPDGYTIHLSSVGR
jgi:hypothetical protein